MELPFVFCIEQPHELDTRFHQVRYLASRGTLSDRKREHSEETIDLWLLLLLYMEPNMPNTTLTASRPKQRSLKDACCTRIGVRAISCRARTA